MTERIIIAGDVGPYYAVSSVPRRYKKFVL